MAGAETESEIELAANELYWGSERSVNQIAEKLDVSKGTLYGLIRPRPAGLSCPTCGQEVVHPNRTAKERALVACASCGWEGQEEDAEPFASEGAGVPRLAVEDAEQAAEDLEQQARARTVIGGALLGAAAGIALLLWLRRR